MPIRKLQMTKEGRFVYPLAQKLPDDIPTRYEEVDLPQEQIIECQHRTTFCVHDTFHDFVTFTEFNIVSLLQGGGPVTALSQRMFSTADDSIPLLPLEHFPLNHYAEKVFNKDFVDWTKNLT